MSSCIAATLVAACGQGGGPDGTVDAEIVQLDTEGVESLGSDIATCLRDIAGVQVADDFLLSDDSIPFSFDQATPEQEQALVQCFSSVQGIEELDPGVLEVDLDG